MIVVKIELHSYYTGVVTLLGLMTISNDGTSYDAQRGNYDAQLKRAPKFKRDTRTARVENWPRQRKTVWQLLHRALDNLYA